MQATMDIARGDATELERELAIALGTAWDEELETYRRAVVMPSLVSDESRAI